MREIEVKILHIDKQSLYQQLERLGAVRVTKPTMMRELYFEPADGSKQLYSSLRLRTDGSRSYLTKKVRENDNTFNIHEETESAVHDFNFVYGLLEALGYRVFRKREKIREEFTMNNVKIELDEYPGVPPYIEVEGPDKEQILEVIRRLGFSESHITKKPATAVIRDLGLDPNNLLFP